MCYVYVHLVCNVPSSPSGCAGSWFSCDGVCLVVLCQSVLLCEVLSLPCVVLSLCVCVLVPGNVISGGCTISDGSS